jgi:uncharacterized protein YggE
MAKKDSIGLLSVTGEGQVRAKPDVATLRLGVLSEAKTASDAVTANAVAMTQVIEAVKGLGVAEGALQTVGLNLYPVLSYDEPNARNVIVGYRAEDTLSVETAVELAGKVFDAAVKNGANESSGLAFGRKDETELRDKALVAAVAAAKRDAEVVMKAMGVDAKGVRSIDIEQGGGPLVVRSTARFDKAASTPVMAGEITVTARVRVSFDYYD